MADSGIKKVVILKKDLPAFNSNHGDYILRYRVISEDKNRWSHWSPQYKINALSVAENAYKVAVDSVNEIINIVWTPTEQTSNTTYDIFLKWDSSDWVYASTVSTTSYAIIKKTGATKLKIAAQVPTFPKQRSDRATIFESNELSL